MLSAYSQVGAIEFLNSHREFTLNPQKFDNPSDGGKSKKCTRTYFYKNISCFHSINRDKTQIYSDVQKKWIEVSKELVELFDRYQISLELLVKATNGGFSTSSLKKMAPFLKEIDSHFMMDYIDKMETLLELPSPSNEASSALYKRALNAICINATNDKFNSWVQDLLQKLSEIPLGKLLLEEWITYCAKHTVQPKIIEVDCTDYLCGDHALGRNEIHLKYKDELLFRSLTGEMQKAPYYISLAHEMLHCIRDDAGTTRTHLKSIGRELSNAEEQYVILGIEKKLYTEAKINSISHRLLDYLCEAAFFLREGLPPRIYHNEIWQSSVDLGKINANLKKVLNPMQLKTIFYHYVAEYTKYELDIIFEQRENRKIVIEAVRRNGQLYPYASPSLLRDREVMVNALQNNPSAYHSMVLLLTGEEGFKTLIQAIPTQPSLIRYIDVENPYYEEFAFIALRNFEPFTSFSQRWREGNRAFKLEAMRIHGYNAFNLLPEVDKADFDIALSALIRDHHLVFEILVPSLKNDKLFAMRAVSKSSFLLKLFLQYNRQFTQDKEFILASAYDTKCDSYYGPIELLEDREFFYTIALINPSLAIKNLPNSYFENRDEILKLIDLIKKHHTDFLFTQKTLRWFVNRIKKFDISF